MRLTPIPILGYLPGHSDSTQADRVSRDREGQEVPLKDHPLYQRRPEFPLDSGCLRPAGQVREFPRIPFQVVQLKHRPVRREVDSRKLRGQFARGMALLQILPKGTSAKSTG